MPLNTLLKIAIDQQNRVLVPSFQGSADNIVDIYAGEQQPFQVQLVNPSGGQVTRTYAAISMAGTTLDISVSATPSGTNVVAAVAEIKNIAWDAANQWHFGTLDLSPAPVYTLIGTGASVDAWIEFRFWNAALPIFTFQKQFRLLAPIDKGSIVTPPVPAVAYYNTQQADGKFIPYEIPAGFAVTFLTSDPKKKLALTVGDDLVPVWTKIILP